MPLFVAVVPPRMAYVGVQPKKFSARFARSNICTPHSQNCGAAPEYNNCSVVQSDENVNGILTHYVKDHSTLLFHVIPVSYVHIIVFSATFLHAILPVTLSLFRAVMSSLYNNVAFLHLR